MIIFEKKLIFLCIRTKDSSNNKNSSAAGHRRVRYFYSS